MCTVSTPCQTAPELNPAVTAASQFQCCILDYHYRQKLELKALPLLYSAKLSNGSVMLQYDQAGADPKQVCSQSSGQALDPRDPTCG